MAYPNPTVWIVSDVSPRSAVRASVYDFAADYPSADEIEFIAASLSDAFDVKTVSTSDFDVARIPESDIVFPLWVGGKSRNRTALIPALCELRNIKHVGADAFVHSSCQDKNFSKLIAKQFGIDSPSGLVLSHLVGTEILGRLNFPVVVKPLYGGASIGITESNLCQNQEDAYAVAKEIFDRDLGPVIVEEFIKGEEYYMSFFINMGRIHDYQAVKWVTDKGETFLSDKLFHFDLKVNWDVDLRMEECGDHVPDYLLQRLERLFQYFSPIDIMRCDFRGPLDNLKLIELTPDMNLAPDAEFVGGFHQKGYGFPEIYTKIVRHAQEKY